MSARLPESYYLSEGSSPQKRKDAGASDALLLSRRWAAEQALTSAAQRDVLCVGVVAAITSALRFNRHLVTDLHRVALPALSQQLTRARHLEAPVRDRAVGILHVDEEPDVGIGPLHLRHGPGHLHRLVLVELRGKRVVRQRPSGRRQRRHTHHSNHESCSHSYLPVVLGASRRRSRSLLFSHRCSSSSVSGRSTRPMFLDVQGCEYALGSSMVTLSSNVPKLVR